MAYRTFSTTSADYILELGNGIKGSSSNRHFGSLDALVIESGYQPPGHILAGNVPERSKHTTYAGHQGIPVFFTDCYVAPSSWARSFLSWIPICFIVAPLGIAYSVTEKRMPTLVQKSISTLMYLSQDPIIAGRNAVNAEKIEEEVVPIIAKRIGRRPKIGVVFDSGHAGIEDDLKSRKRRRLTLANYRHAASKPFGAFKIDEVDRIVEANVIGGYWKLTTHAADIAGTHLQE